jgi:signal transduction histidine kinase
MSSLQLLIEDEKMSSNDRQEVLNGALSCGEGLLSTLNDILSIAKTKYTSSVGLRAYCITTLLHDVEAILKPFAVRRDVVFSQHQMLLSAARGDTEVNWTSLSQVKGDITIIKQVSRIPCPPAVHLQPLLKSVNVKHRTHAHTKCLLPFS